MCQLLLARRADYTRTSHRLVLTAATSCPRLSCSLIDKSKQYLNMPAPTQFLSYIDSHADAFIQRLADAVAIPS